MMKKLFCMICTAAALQGFLAHAAENEWAFDAEPAGSELSQAINYGLSPTNFATGFGATLFTTNKTLLYTGAAVADPWNNGAILDATVSSKLSGTNYLRYDLKYSITNRLQNWTQKMFGVYFTDATGAKAAGMVLGYDINSLNTDPLKPANRTVTAIATNLPRQGSLAVISEVSLDTQTLRVWYSFDGTFNYDSPSYVTNVTLDSIDALRLHATGDFPGIGENDFVSMDHIRQSSLWSEIIEDLPTVTVPGLQITLVSPRPVMDVGDTNEMVFVIKNMGCSATNVSSVLYHNSAPSSFTMVSNNTPVNLLPLRSVTNTYQIVANVSGTYPFTLKASSTQTSTQTNIPVVVGEEVRYISNAIDQLSGGVMPDAYEPGEQLRITVFSRNSGAKKVNEVVSSLASSSSFTVSLDSASTNRFVNVEVGDVVTSVYNVAISPAVADGNHVFYVVNRSSMEAWTNTFVLPVLNRAIPLVLTTNLTVNVIAGEKQSGVITLTNSGNVPISFEVEDDGTLPFSTYGSEIVSRSLVPFDPVLDGNDATVITNWVDAGAGEGNFSSTPSLIGFEFPFAGKTFTNFSIYTDGRILLGNEMSDYIIPYNNDSNVSTNMIRVRRESGLLTVTWGDDFQALLHANGDILFLYGAGSYSPDRIRLEYGSTVNLLSDMIFDAFPGAGNGVLFRKVPSWVTISPRGGSVAGLDDSFVMVHADASAHKNETTSYPIKLLVNWGNGSVVPVSLTVNVKKADPGLNVTSNTISSITNVWFAGNNGVISVYTNMVLVNTGNVSLAYSIVNNSARVAGFDSIVITNCAWVTPVDSDIANFGALSSGEIELLTDRTGRAVLDDGYSSLIPIGFEFPFAGIIYTNLSIGVNGGISLGESRPMDVYQVAYYTTTVNDGESVQNVRSNFYLYNVLNDPAYIKLLPPPTGKVYLSDYSTWTNPVPPRFIAPFWADLILAEDSDISYNKYRDRFVVTWERLKVVDDLSSDLTFQVVLTSDGTIRFQYQRMVGYSLMVASSGIRDFLYTQVVTNLVISNSVVTTNVVTNQVNTYCDVPVGNIVDLTFETNFVTTVSNLYDREIVVTNGTNYVVTGYMVDNREINIKQPGQVISMTPRVGLLPVGASQKIDIFGDARHLTLSSSSEEFVNNFSILSKLPSGADAWTNDVTVHFTVSEPVGPISPLGASEEFSASDELMFGSDGLVSVLKNSDGSKTISIPRPTLGAHLDRTFTLEFTTSLMSPWQVLKVLEYGEYSFTDRAHMNEPVIYYRVTVQ